MVEPITYQQQRKNFVYIPDELFSVLFIQKLYDKVYHQTAAGTIKQFHNNLDSVVNDQKEAIRASGFVKANNFGKNDEYILNPDIDKNNLTAKELNSLINKLRLKFKGSADLKHLCFMFFASHGMAYESTQHIVLNEFDKINKFYKLYAAEN